MEIDSSDDDDDDFFNNPELHKQLDQVEIQFKSTQSQQQQQQQREEVEEEKEEETRRPTKKQKTSKEPIEQTRRALQESEQCKLRLNGQVAIIKTQLETTKTTHSQQLGQLEKLKQHYKTRAEHAEQQLARLEHAQSLKDTFTALEQTAHRTTPARHKPITTRNVLGKNNPASTSKLTHLQHSFVPPTQELRSQQPRPTFNQQDQSTQKLPHQHAHPEPRPSIPFKKDRFSPVPATQSPPFTSPCPAAAAAAAPTDNSQQLIHSVIIRLFHSFVVSLRAEGTSAPAEPDSSGDRRPARAPVAPSLQTILDAALQLPCADPALKPAFDELVLELFTCLASAFGDDARPSDHHHFVPSSSSSSSGDDALVMRFVARLGACFVQISALLSRTHLIEAQTEAVHVLTILVQASPLFTSSLLHHPDFEAYREPAPVRPPPDILAVLLAHFNHLHRAFFASAPTPTPSPPSSSPSSSTAAAAPHSPPNGLPEHPSLTPLLLTRLHFALLDLLDALIWDPPEACYPTWEKFLKAHSQPFFQFLLVLPRRYPHAAGVAEKEDDVMLTQKSVDVLLSLASKVGFSQIILDAKVVECSPVSCQTTPPTSNPSGRPSQPQPAKPLPTKDVANGRSTVTPRETAEPSRSEVVEEGSMTVVDRLMKMMMVAATHQEVYRAGSGSTGTGAVGDGDRHGLKVKMLSLLHMLAAPHHHGGQQPSADAEWAGWQALPVAGSFVFSALIKTIFNDVYRLWNADGAVGHRVRVPLYVERIALAVEAVHKMVFPQQPSAGSNGPRPLNLIHRLKQETGPFGAVLGALSALFVPSSPATTTTTVAEGGSAAAAGTTTKATTTMVIGTHSTVYHEFVVCFSKLAWLDYVTPTASSSYPFPWIPAQKHFASLFLCDLPKHLFWKLDLVADLAYDVLASVASPDELDEWKRCALDDDSDEEEEEEAAAAGGGAGERG
ncbi:hypothetical protein PCANC_03128 [Puccinia coronata f. sp. avenae]|uniref:Uncharacterized protein n=1 Tax=Puccinia coronata f. sp. avenae TaxID=200324 RepID=A0A2N5W4K2_9BASI|nr:hypothetical protein PCANC_25896 [Puccinia coronata f. sp. avenae]PLW21624.1 hypothetical protein PCASD_18377 [Puccinia coronata f. sp. avenae]PLW57176.1 hypothetical protein PCANC_03128 [Puccinia coronata f. sp. avenae]